MLIKDSVVHEFDAIRYLTGEEIKNVQVRLGRATRHAQSGQHDPQHVLIETENGLLADVEIFVNAQFGYQVTTQAVFEKGIVNIGEDGGPYVRSRARWGGEITPGFVERFRSAYDSRGAELGRCRQDEAKWADPPLGMAMSPQLVARQVWLRKRAARRSRFL